MNSRKGYSVFEVLIAFAIMALVLGALLPGQARLLARASNSDDTVLAYDFALSRLATLSVSDPLAEGQAPMDHGRWQTHEEVRTSHREGGVVQVDVIIRVFDASGREIARAVNSRIRPNE